MLKVAEESLSARHNLSSHKVIVNFYDSFFSRAKYKSVILGNLKIKALHVGDPITVLDMSKFCVSGRCSKPVEF